MILNKDRQKFVKAVGILFILQGLAWFCCALAGIIVKKAPPNTLIKTPITEYTQYSQYLARIIYDDFMRITSTRDVDKVIRPQDFEAFLWIYMILSAVWVAASLDQILAIKHKKSRQSHITLVLGVAILLTSIIDFVFVALLGRDLATCSFDLSPSTTEPTATSVSPTTTTSSPTATSSPTEYPEYSSESGESTNSSPSVEFLSLVLLQASSSGGTSIDCQLANGIIMSLAARGYVLWLINVILAVCLIKIGARALKGPTILTYENNPIPRARMPESKKTTPSPSNEMIFYGDSDVYSPPAPSVNSNRNRMSMPAALNNKNQNIYY